MAGGISLAYQELCEQPRRLGLRASCLPPPRSAHGSLSPLSAFLGGVAAQEVIKSATRRYTPLQQFMYIDGSDALPIPRPSD